jgi:DNA-binding NarL/FixJ family response regulator
MEIASNSGRDELRYHGQCKGRRVVICEDHPATLFGLRDACLKLGCDVVAETSLGSQAIEFVEVYAPDLLLLDQYLQDSVDGRTVQREIRRRGLATKVFVFTNYCDSPDFFDWINQPDGPDAVLEKTTSLYHLRTAIATVLTSDKRYIPERILNKESGGADNPLNKLAPHELKVLRDVARGYQLKEIAVSQHLAVYTVRSYMKEIYRKLDLRIHTLQEAALAYNRWTAGGGGSPPVPASRYFGDV